jgi:hypothetical protein
MGLITQTYPFVAGAIPTASQWNSNWTTVLALVNGQIDENNVDYTSADGIVTMAQTQTISGAKTFSGSTTHTGAMLFSNTVTVGVDGTGYDVKFFGDTTGAFSLYDQSADTQIIQGATAAGAGTLKLSTGELTNVDGGILGRIDFQAPLDSAGTDAILVGASIWAEVDDTFSASLNDTDLVFAVAESEAALERMRLAWDGTTTNLHFAQVANISSTADITLTPVGDVNLPANIGLTFGNDGEKIEGDGTDLTISGNNINLTAVADVVIPANVGLTFGTGEKIEGDSTDLTVTSGGAINLTAVTDVVIPANVGITFGAGEKIEGDSTDLTVTSGGAINLTAVTDVVIPANVGITFGTGEKIEGDSTDLTVTSGGAINLTAVTDVVIPANVGLTFGTGEKIEGDNTDLTVTSGGLITLTATGNTVVTNNAIVSGTLGAGATTVTSLSATDGNITQVGDISLDSISSDSDTTITVTLGTDAGDDFIVGNNSALVVSGDTSSVGFGTATPGENDANGTTVQLHGIAGSSTLHMTNNTTGSTISDGFLAVQSGLDMLMINREAGAVAFRTSDTERMRITSAGVVNISNLTASSDVQTDGSKNLVSVSDQRLKTDDGVILGSALDIINQLTPRYFRYKSDEANGVTARQLGFYAQEVNPLIPEAAPVFDLYEKDEDGNDIGDPIDQEWGFNGRGIQAFLVKAIQELTARVVSLEV